MTDPIAKAIDTAAKDFMADLEKLHERDRLFSRLVDAVAYWLPENEPLKGLGGNDIRLNLHRQAWTHHSLLLREAEKLL